MRWTPGGMSSDVEDDRGNSGGFGGFGGFGRVPLGIGGLIVLGVLSLLTGKNFLAFFTGGPSPSTQTSGEADRSAAPVQQTPQESREVQFVSWVLDDVQHTWDSVLPRQTGKPYRHAKLVLFRDAVQSGCGTAQAATGPFYCPDDEKVYIDLSFYDQLRDQFGAPGEFAQAYVIAHEIGHHVQKILGIEAQVRRAQGQDPRMQNPLSVGLELQADCFAGVWGHTTEQRNIIDQADIAQGLHAASAIGDDRLQRMSQGYVTPDTFTHGTSTQREHWFNTGLEQGAVSSCDTFGQNR